MLYYSCKVYVFIVPQGLYSVCSIYDQHTKLRMKFRFFTCSELGIIMLHSRHLVLSQQSPLTVKRRSQRRKQLATTLTVSSSILPSFNYHQSVCPVTIGNQVWAVDNYLSSEQVQVLEHGRRIPSCHIRELSRGNFLIKSEDVALLDKIGEGMYVIQFTCVKFYIPIQENLGSFTERDSGFSEAKLP